MNSEEFFLPTAKINNGARENSGIYFLQSSEGYIKIGKTGNVFKRLSNYKTHNSTIRIVGFIWTVEKFLDINETTQHDLWQVFRVSGEWFAPVIPLVQYISHFWHGKGLAVETMFFESKLETYQELLRLQCDDFQESTRYERTHQKEIKEWNQQAGKFARVGAR